MLWTNPFTGQRELREYVDDRIIPALKERARRDLERIVQSIAETSREASAPVLTGDTKVMGRGEIDGIVINTSGVGMTRHLYPAGGLKPGNRIIVTGTIGDHGMAVMAKRHGLGLDVELLSDVAPLNGLIRQALRPNPSAVTAMKDPTRGGVATSLHEMASKSGVGIVIQESALPIRQAVKGVSEIVGIDPLLVANEGKAVMGVVADDAYAVLEILRGHPLGRDAAIIGTVVEDRPGTVIVDTGFGRRLLAEPEGELLPRIC